MRYLKLFESFDDSDTMARYQLFEADGPLDTAQWHWTKDLTIPRDIQMDIYDMAFELKDEGYNVSYQWWPPYEQGSRFYKDNKYPTISITKSNPNEEGGLEKIYYPWIEDFCQRIISYLDEKGYNAVVKFRKDNSRDYTDIKNSVMTWGPFGDKPMANSIRFNIEMISRRVYGDVNESKELDQSVIDECKDILLELEDIGIKTNIHSYLSYSPQTNNEKWIQFFFNRVEEFDYSDIEDVVERLKSYLSEYNLHIKWQNQSERGENKPTIKTTRVMDPTTFEPFIRTQCELYFTSN